jgi:hypothetical protein
MDANFTGPSYTLGIEEELMILRSETCELANEIDAVIEAYEGGDGEVKPELLQSVLEIATPVSKDLAEAGGARCPRPRPPGDFRSARRAPTRPPSGSTSACPSTPATAS